MAPAWPAASSNSVPGWTACWPTPCPIICYCAPATRYAAARGVFQLILDETADPAASPLVLERLTDLLIFFMLRHLAARDPQAHGLLVLARDPAMAGLLQAILAEPALPWSLQDMADRLHMSKATFHRRFTLHSGTTPAQLLQALRMRAARRLLEQGAGIQEAAERVGYQSQAAFSRAFQRAEGMAPSACRSARPAPSQADGPALPASGQAQQQAEN